MMTVSVIRCELGQRWGHVSKPKRSLMEVGPALGLQHTLQHYRREKSDSDHSSVNPSSVLKPAHPDCGRPFRFLSSTSLNCLDLWTTSLISQSRRLTVKRLFHKFVLWKESGYWPDLHFCNSWTLCHIKTSQFNNKTARLSHSVLKTRANFHTFPFLTLDWCAGSFLQAWRKHNSAWCVRMDSILLFTAFKAFFSWGLNTRNQVFKSLLYLNCCDH